MSFFDWFRRKKGKPPKPAPVVVPPSKPVVPSWDPPMVTSVFSNWATPCPYFYDFPGIGLRRIVTGTEAPFYEPWKAIRTKDRTPAIGEYDERQIEVERWRLQQMRDVGKINVACRQVGWSHMRAVKPLDWLPQYDPLLYRWAVDNHMAIPNSGVRFCLSNWFAPEGTDDGPILFEALKRDNKWDSDDLRMSMRLYAQSVGKIMQHPDYWLIDGRPVLYRGWAHTLPWYSERFGFDVSAQEVVSIWKDEIKKLVGVEPFLVATSMDENFHKDLAGWGFSGVTQYLLHGKGWAEAMVRYRDRWRADLATCRKYGLKYIVPVTSGYNGEAWNTPEYQAGYTHEPTPPQLTVHVREGRTVAINNPDVCIAVGSYSFTEIGEQRTTLEPKKPEIGGDTMLRAHADACT